MVTGHASVTAKSIITDMLGAMDNIRTLRYTLKCTERINGKIRSSESFAKLQRSPRKLYLYLKGPELLWVDGQNSGKALVNPNAFPFINLSLDPYGSILRKDQHHTIHEVGFDYLGGVIQAAIKKVGDKFDKFFVYTGSEKVNDKDCYKVIINNPDFTFVPYVVKKNETIISIARALKVSECEIMENNPAVKDLFSIREGDRLKVPTDYAKLTVLYIDKQNFLPIKNTVMDDKGLFEAYEYHNLQVNVKIPDEEFLKSYKDYHF